MKNLDKVLDQILAESKKVEPKQAIPIDPGQYDYDYAKNWTDGYAIAKEPEEKFLVAIQNCFISGDFDKANKIINIYQKAGGSFSYYYLDQLANWVKNIYKYTNMKDLSKQHYNYPDKEKIQGVEDLKKYEVKKGIVEKFVKDVEKVLKKKLEMK